MYIIMTHSFFASDYDPLTTLLLQKLSKLHVGHNQRKLLQQFSRAQGTRGTAGTTPIMTQVTIILVKTARNNRNKRNNIDYDHIRNSKFLGQPEQPEQAEQYRL